MSARMKTVIKGAMLLLTILVCGIAKYYGANDLTSLIAIPILCTLWLLLLFRNAEKIRCGISYMKTKTDIEETIIYCGTVSVAILASVVFAVCIISKGNCEIWGAELDAFLEKPIYLYLLWYVVNSALLGAGLIAIIIFGGSLLFVLPISALGMWIGGRTDGNIKHIGDALWSNHCAMPLWMFCFLTYVALGG